MGAARPAESGRAARPHPGASRADRWGRFDRPARGAPSELAWTQEGGAKNSNAIPSGSRKASPDP